MTEFAALSFADTIRRSIGQGQLTGTLFIDLHKAFDTVDHGMLLDFVSYLQWEVLALSMSGLLTT